MLAEAAGHLAAATAAADATLDAEPWELALLVAVAKARVGEAAGRVAATAHQVHAAMGFTQEHMLHYATRRLWSWRDEFGSEPYWQRQVGSFVCRLGGEALWPLLTDGDAARGFADAPAGSTRA
jgi:acyl-CoA dehydrogenase